ncbi:ADP-ribosylglycohydrolase [Rhodoferax antarcticus]|nr:ADP-ribosylglycohydrolase [Rhodoferax antarcticus]
MSSNGRCFDIGIATRAALQRFARHGDPLAGSVDPQSAGNGCLMRLAPVPIRYMHQLERAVQYSQEQARTTHQAPECLDASGLFGEILVRALQGRDKDAVLAPPIWAGPLPGKLQAICRGKPVKNSVGRCRRVAEHCGQAGGVQNQVQPGVELC